tara:strand:- start:1095 stop:1430 length:336 start_codon:yes stop_codon:yes gene_type:complete
MVKFFEVCISKLFKYNVVGLCCVKKNLFSLFYIYFVKIIKTQYKNGLLDEETWLAYRHVILINHSTELGRKWWDKIGRGIVAPDFAKLVDELLVDAKPDDTYQRMATWAES